MEWLGYMHQYGDNPQIQGLERELLRDLKIADTIDAIINTKEHTRLIQRIQIHMRSICVELSQGQIDDYRWWVETYITHDNPSQRYKQYVEEYKLAQNEAILCLIDLENSEVKNYSYYYHKYISRLQKMYKIYFIKNGLRDSHREPPDSV